MCGKKKGWEGRGMESGKRGEWWGGELSGVG